MNTIINKTRVSVIGIVLGALCIVPVAMGGELTIPKSWVTGEALTAADLNGNFQAVETEVDENNGRITNNVAGIAGHETRIVAIETVNAKGDGFSLDAADGNPVDVLSADADGVINISTRLGVGRVPIHGISVNGNIYTTNGIKLGGPEPDRRGLLELRNSLPWTEVIYATNQNGNQLFALSNTGAVTVSGIVTAAGHVTVSDSRYKRDIVTLETPLEKLLELRGVSFMWDTDKHVQFRDLPGKQVGFIAQEVKNVLPETVFKNEDGYLGVSYNAIVPLLVEAVKAQQQAIKELTKEIGSIEQLRQEMRVLRQQINVIQAKNDDKHTVGKQRLSSLINNK